MQTGLAGGCYLAIVRPITEKIGDKVICALNQNQTLTLWTIPANARAVYAPRENPNMQILSPSLS